MRPSATSPPYPTPRGAIPWGYPARVIEKWRSAEISAQLNRSQQRTSDEQGRKCHPHENPVKQAFSIPLGHHPFLNFSGPAPDLLIPGKRDGGSSCSQIDTRRRSPPHFELTFSAGYVLRRILVGRRSDFSSMLAWNLARRESDRQIPGDSRLIALTPSQVPSSSIRGGDQRGVSSSYGDC